MTTSIPSAPEATRLLNKAQAERDAATAHEHNVKRWVTAGSGTFSHADLLAAENDVKIKNSILTAAIAAHSKANKGIEATDDRVADYLLELFEENRYEFGLTGATFDKRKRPGKGVPAALPEIAFCQQSDSVQATGAITGECFVVVYGAEGSLPTLDTKTIRTASDKMGGVLEIGNAVAPEVLETMPDGTEVYRKQYRVFAKRVSPMMPIIPELPTEEEALRLADGVARDLRSMNVSSTAYGASSITRVKILAQVDASSATVAVDGEERKVTFVVSVGTQGRYGNFGYDEILARSAFHIAQFATGRVGGTIGRVKSAQIVHSSPVSQSAARITVEVVGEAKTA